MSLFSRLFGRVKKNTDDGGGTGLTPDQFLATSYVQDILAKTRKDAVLLNPQTAHQPLSPALSKFGGLPNLNGFESYPGCDSCDTPLNFVLQLYKSDFSTHYFPEDRNLFQLYRCPNSDCPEAYSDACNADHKMFVYYFDCKLEEVNAISMPGELSDMEPRVPDCFLKPAKIADYPLDEVFDNVLTKMRATFGEELTEYFSEEFGPAQRTKAGGYPSFTQSVYYPTCDCGNLKEFFFQLSSADIEEGVTNPVPDNWSPHHIMIGDLGNIYFYVCKACGEKSIESYWDCH